MNRIYAIGDIHGRMDLLSMLLGKLKTEENLKFDDGDKIIFMGDYVDRGPDSDQVLGQIKALTDDHPKSVVALRGNHETLAIEGTLLSRQHAKELWLYNGGYPTMQSFGGFIPDEWIKWLSALPLFHEEPGFFFSHAPAPIDSQRRGNKSDPFTLHELTWTYHEDEAWFARQHGPGIVGVCGHIHQLRRGIASPRMYDHYIFTDAGCGCADYAPLCAVEVKSRKIIYADPAKLVCVEEVK